MDKERLKILTENINTLKNLVTKKEFLTFSQTLVKQVLAVEKLVIDKTDKKTAQTLKDLQELKDTFKDIISQAKKNSESTFGQIKQRAVEAVESVFVKSNLNQKLKDGLQKIDDRLSELSNIKDGDDADEEMIVENVLARIPKLEIAPEEIANKLESLPEQGKLVINAIKGLRAELDEIKKEKTMIVPAGGASGGGIVKAYDISDSLDGSTKIFSLPAFWRVISVHTSSFPNALRPTIDYTTDASTMKITFTDEISVSSTLATGQTVIIVYAE